MGIDIINKKKVLVNQAILINLFHHIPLLNKHIQNIKNIQNMKIFMIWWILNNFKFKESYNKAKINSNNK